MLLSSVKQENYSLAPLKMIGDWIENMSKGKSQNSKTKLEDQK